MRLVRLARAATARSMIFRFGLVSMLVALGSEHAAWAQPESDEPTPPGQRAPSRSRSKQQTAPKKSATSKKMPSASKPAPKVKTTESVTGTSATGLSDEPAAPISDEPRRAPGDEPASPSRKGEPGGAVHVDEPGGDTSGEPETDTPTLAHVPGAEDDAVHFGLGVHLRAIFFHPWMLRFLFEESTPVNSTAFGAEAVVRYGRNDFIGAVEFGFFTPEDGNYLESGDDPRTQTDYLDFRDFNSLYLSVHYVRHFGITNWMSFVLGGGVGIQVFLGNVFRVSNDADICTPENASDEDQCFPKGMDPTNRSAFLNATQNQGTRGEDTPDNPKVFEDDRFLPAPVLPLVHLMAGLNFDLGDFNLRVDGGFRNAFYFGATLQYFLF